MRTNGFIFIAMGLAAVSMAGSPGYLPSVGPIALRFDSEVAPPVAPTQAAIIVSETPSQTVPPPEVVADIPVEALKNPPPDAATLMHDIPVALPAALLGSATNLNQPLIGPTVDTNGVVTPQMFLRFFTPSQSGVSREAIIIPSTDFTPARPPAPSSTATYKINQP